MVVIMGSCDFVYAVKKHKLVDALWALFLISLIFFFPCFKRFSELLYIEDLYYNVWLSCGNWKIVKSPLAIRVVNKELPILRKKWVL